MTIADSKKAFHKAFPYVIPPIYRRVTDELLVELHLLTHQKDFVADTIFAIGLINVFNEFTQGYKPAKHLTGLFEALCRSNGLDPVELQAKSSNALGKVKEVTPTEILDSLNNAGQETSHKLQNLKNDLSRSPSHYSRLLPIGLYKLLTSAKKEEQIDLEEITKTLSKEFGFSMDRVEKDLGTYKSNLEKISQALELIQESVVRERSKREKENSKRPENIEV